MEAGAKPRACGLFAGSKHALVGFDVLLVDVRASPRATLLNVAVETFDGRLVALRLDVPVGVGRLADARVAELLLHPPQVRPVAQQPGGEGVSGRVIAAIRSKTYRNACWYSRIPDSSLVLTLA